MQLQFAAGARAQAGLRPCPAQPRFHQLQLERVLLLLPLLRPQLLLPLLRPQVLPPQVLPPQDAAWHCGKERRDGGAHETFAAEFGLPRCPFWMIASTATTAGENCRQPRSSPHKRAWELRSV